MTRFCLTLILLTLLTAAASPPLAQTNEAWMPPACETYDRLYWETRPIVTAIIRCDTSGGITSVELLGDTSPEDYADSLLTLTKQWVQRERSQCASGRRRHKQFAYFTLGHQDPAPSDAAARRLPRFATSALSESPYDDWVTAWASRTPGFSLEQFITCGFKPMHRIEAEGLLDTPHLARKADRGLLRNSPDGKYVLDPFEGMEISDTGAAGWDVDSGYATYDAETGDRLHYYVGTMSRIDLAHWVSAKRFMLLGMATLDHLGPIWPERRLLRVPAIWIGDIAEEKIALYLGLPALSIYDSVVIEEAKEIRARAFPDMAW